MPLMQLYHATALIALLMIVVLSAGYAAGEHKAPEPVESVSSSAPRS